MLCSSATWARIFPGADPRPDRVVSSPMTAPLTVPTPASATATKPLRDTALLANAIRALAMDAVQAANSGHPGMPMGMAEIAVALWQRHLRHNPGNPHWPDRDRFVLSNGHGSMLQYALLHLTGYALPLDELKRFRQLHSKTPGHPEVGVTPGVETTTGPLGQGLANAVGMALAERLLAAEFNRPGHRIVNHHTYVFVGDGCLMEGISHEACSLAGTLGLGKLIVFYDDNGISIDGHCKGWFTDDTPQRFEAYNWHVISHVDGHDVDAVDAAIRSAQAVADRPTLIQCKTIIGKGSPNRAGTELAHGQALGEKEVALTRAALGWSYPPFEIPPAVYDAWNAAESGARLEARLECPLRRLPGGASAACSRIPTAHGELFAGGIRSARGGAGAAAERSGRVDRDAQGVAAGARSARSRAAGVDRRRRGSDRVGVHQLVGQQDDQRDRIRQLHLFRRTRIRDERDRQRPGIAPRIHSVCWYLPDLLGLCAQRGAHGCTDAAAFPVRVHARLDRPGRRRPDAPID